MKTVWKFVLDKEIRLEMPMGAEVLMVGAQGLQWCLWASVDPDQPRDLRSFMVTGTGHPIPPEATHLGSFQQPPFVWHVWEIP